MLGIQWMKTARKQMRRLDTVTRARVLYAVTHFASDGIGDVVPLVGRSGYRLRVGDWRVLFDLDGPPATLMTVSAVRPRGGAYK